MIPSRVSNFGSLLENAIKSAKSYLKRLIFRDIDI